jgi:hypothetical protein
MKTLSNATGSRASGSGDLVACQEADLVACQKTLDRPHRPAGTLAAAREFPSGKPEGRKIITHGASRWDTSDRPRSLETGRKSSPVPPGQPKPTET